jgi:hypothetical protein
VPWPARPALTLAASLAAAAPVIASTVKAVRDGWVPGADQAIIATRAYDVFTSHTPLVGQYTLAGQVTGQVTHSLGPLLFWLLALPARFGGPTSMTWTMGAVNTLAILATVALARRRGGVVLMFATALAVALMCQSLAAETFHDVWNPSAGLFPFTLLIFLCWSLACGEHRLLPTAVLVGSFVVQAHLMYLPPTAGLLAVGLGGLALSRRARRRAGAAPRADHRDGAHGARASPERPPRAQRTPLLRWGLAALLVGAVCWSAPVVDQLTERPGNMKLVFDTALTSKTTLGASAGWHAVVRAVGAKPWWLYVPRTRWDRKYDVRSTPHAGAVASCVALLALLGIVGIVALVRRRRDVAAAALIGFVLCAALAAVAASTPTPRVLSATLGYTMWWGSQVGMWVWLVLAWSAWLALAWLARAAGARELGRGAARSLAGWHARGLAAPAPALGTLARVLGATAAVGATLAVGVAVAGTGQPDEHRPTYRPTAELAARLEQAIPSGRTVQMVGSLDLATMPIKPALRYLLARHGVRALARGSYLRLGSWYELYDRPFQFMVYVDDGVHRPSPQATLLDRVRFADGFGPQVVSLWIERVPRAALASCGVRRWPCSSPTRAGASTPRRTPSSSAASTRPGRRSRPRGHT